MAELMAERGAGASGVSTAEVLERAGVSSGVFEALFADREAALLAAFDLGVERVRPKLVAAYEAESRWLDGVKAGLAVLLRSLEAEPALGRLCVVHSMSGGADVLRRRMEILDGLAAIIDRGRLEAAAGRRPPPLIAEGLVGAVVAILQNRMLGEAQRPPMELYGSLVSMIVLPYLGAGVARRELTRPVPRVRSEGDHGEAPPPQGGRARARIRLTYRTTRVLSSIGDYPGASNREVAERAGIVDQGQISKLLNRLEARALVEKLGDVGSRGAPNSWRLTEEGEVLLRSAAASRSGTGSSGPSRGAG